MTEKQIEKIRVKIKKIRSALAAEKRMFGGYDDSRGLRYLPPGLFIKISDFTGGLTYLRWFAKNFSHDIGFPDFLFEWTLILYQKGKFHEAEKKAFQTFCANTYLFDKFFCNTIVPLTKYESSNMSIPEFTDSFKYSQKQEQLKEFSEWLKKLTSSEKFEKLCNDFVSIQKRLLTEHDITKRKELLKQEDLLLDEI